MKRFPIFKPRTHDFWTENEKERLRRLYADSTLSVHKIAKRMNRTTESVYKKAAELHLYRKGRRRRDNLQHSQHIRPRYDDQDTIVFDEDMLDDEPKARNLNERKTETKNMTNMSNVYYDTPRIPTFVIEEDGRLVRVKRFMYVDGILSMYLPDAGLVDNEQYFYDIDIECGRIRKKPIVYCLYKLNGIDGLYYGEGLSLRELFGLYGGEIECWTYEDFKGNVLDWADILKMPIFDSKKEAIRYVYNI